MLYKGIFKRFFPFLLTFAAGIFLASFFVSVALPTFPQRSERSTRRNECRRIWVENDRLREENERMRNQLQMHNLAEHPPLTFDVPAPPPPPRAPRIR